MYTKLNIKPVKLRPEKLKLQARTGFETMTLRCQCSALPTELSSHLGAGIPVDGEKYK